MLFSVFVVLVFSYLMVLFLEKATMEKRNESYTVFILKCGNGGYCYFLRDWLYLFLYECVVVNLIALEDATWRRMLIPRIRPLSVAINSMLLD